MIPLAGCTKIRLAQTAVDAPAMDVYVDGQRVARNVMLGDISRYKPLPSGVKTIELYPTDRCKPCLLKVKLDTECGRYTTVALTGSVADRSLRLVQIYDAGDTDCKKDTTARLRVIGTVPDAPPIDVYIRDAQNKPILSRIGTFSGTYDKKFTDYVAVPEGRFHIEAFVAGTDTFVLGLPGVEFKAGRAYTIYVIPGSGPSGLAGIQMPDSHNLDCHCPVGDCPCQQYTK